MHQEDLCLPRLDLSRSTGDGGRFDERSAEGWVEIGSEESEEGSDVGGRGWSVGDGGGGRRERDGSEGFDEGGREGREGRVDLLDALLAEHPFDGESDGSIRDGGGGRGVCERRGGDEGAVEASVLDDFDDGGGRERDEMGDGCGRGEDGDFRVGDGRMSREELRDGGGAGSG